MKFTHQLAIYFDDPTEWGYPFDVPEYIETYATFCQLLRDHGIRPYLVRGAERYLGQMQFQSGWELLSDQTLQPVTEPFMVDLIYRKGHNLKTEPTAAIVNHQAIETVCHDKLVTYQQFADFMAPCFPINQANWSEQIQKIKTDKIVVKPVFGTEGRGIIVTNKNNFEYTQLDSAYEPYLIQKFIDTSNGIPDIVNGLHDLRLYMFNGVVKMAEIRQPKPGGYLANIAQGGSLFQLPLVQVPASAIAFVEKIDQHFSQYTPRIYTIDLMYQGDQPYLVELNSQPGLPYREWEKFDHYYTKLHRFLSETLIGGL
ncbi:MAG: ATP-grasp domain-containing protein [Candidatus Kerfeldbacteria bacterium]|nr:ATP-grasp domain-containing protein [Candidatus Kerfeldbacteria bacterium]